MTLRVGLELTVLELDAAGTARAVRGLHTALDACDDVAVSELRHPPSGRGRILRGLDRELRWFPRGLARAAGGLDVLHLPVALGSWRTGATPYVVTVHDTLALDHPSWYARGNTLQQRLVLRRLVERAAAVVTPSTHTARRLDRDDVHVIPWGVGAPFSPGEPDDTVLARHGITSPYVLTVGTLQPRKGLDDLLDLDVPVVVTGARGWQDAEIVDRLRGRATLTGRVTDHELVALLRGAAAMVFPSRHEGFGFPPLEAMACGTPVIAFAASSIPEVTGGAAELADPDEPGALARATARVLGSPDRLGELRAAGLARAGELTWQRCAQRHAELYAAVAG